jgi:hypothetical protein
MSQQQWPEPLLRAMLEEVAAPGYAATTVPHVVAAARVAQRALPTVRGLSQVNVLLVGL